MIDDFFSQPFPVLNVNDALILREQEIRDSEAFFAYYSDKRVGQYILASKPKTLADARAEINYCRSLFLYRKGLYWSLATKSDDKMIGAIGLYINAHHFRGEICYDLSFDYWNRGMMTQALQVAIDYCFSKMGLIRLEAITLAANAPSIALLKKLHFEYEGTLKKYRYYDAHFYDIEMYARIAPDKISITSK